MSTSAAPRRKRYTSDVTDGERALIEPLLPPPRSGNGGPGRPATANIREVWNAIAYVAKAQCQWENLPKDFSPESTVFDHFTRWQLDGTFERVSAVLSRKARKEAGREETPSRGFMDAQAVKCTTTCFGRENEGL